MKKALFIAALILTALPIVAQVEFTVKGTAHKDATTLLLTEYPSQKQPETINVVNGQFTISPEGTLMAIIDREHNMHSFFFVDSTPLTLDMNTDEMKGSVQNEALSKLVRQLSEAKTEEAQTEVLRQGLTDNRDNFVGAFALAQIMYVMSYDELKAELESGAPYLSHPLCQQAKQRMESLALRQPGSMFKDIEEADTLGVNHKLSEYIGKGNYVLVDFWASWCGPCMQEMPNVKANYEKYKSKGFNVVGLSFDRSSDAWKKTIREKNLNWVHLSDLKFWQTVAAQTYGIRSIPSSILCDPTGKIVAVDLRGNQLGATLQEIYGF